MKVHELNVAAHKKRTRVGRGIAAGQGKTAGRGTKGQKSRTGKKIRAGFEGGQLTFMMRTPKKKGFKSFRVPAQVVYTDQLHAIKGKIADNITLADAGLIATPYHSVKIILRSELTKAITVRVQFASKGAQTAITAAGGTFEKVSAPLKPASNKKTDDTK